MELAKLEKYLSFVERFESKEFFFHIKLLRMTFSYIRGLLCNDVTNFVVLDVTLNQGLSSRPGHKPILFLVANKARI